MVIGLGVLWGGVYCRRCGVFVREVKHIRLMKSRKNILHLHIFQNKKILTNLALVQACIDILFFLIFRTRARWTRRMLGQISFLQAAGWTG